MKRGKRYNNLVKDVDLKEFLEVDDAIAKVKENANAKFDESIELHLKLGVDSRHADQQVRGAMVLPHGTGKDVKVAVIGNSEQIKEAEEAGADVVGEDELIERIQKDGWMDFDVLITAPNMMSKVGRLGRILGPRGLMPNPKSGTVTPNIGQAVKETKAGKVEYRLDKNNIIHMVIGKASFDDDKLKENFEAVVETIKRARPKAAKGQYLRSATLTSTMGPGLKLNPVRL